MSEHIDYDKIQKASSENDLGVIGHLLDILDADHTAVTPHPIAAELFEDSTDVETLPSDSIELAAEEEITESAEPRTTKELIIESSNIDDNDSETIRIRTAKARAGALLVGGVATLATITAFGISFLGSKDKTALRAERPSNPVTASSHSVKQQKHRIVFNNKDNETINRQKDQQKRERDLNNSELSKELKRGHIDQNDQEYVAPETSLPASNPTLPEQTPQPSSTQADKPQAAADKASQPAKAVQTGGQPAPLSNTGGASLETPIPPVTGGAQAPSTGEKTSRR